jgi:hypothetical protein
MTRLVPRGRTGLAVFAGAVLLSVGIAMATPSHAGIDHTDTHGDDHSGFTALPANDPARGLIYDGFRVARSGPCKGMLEIKAVPGACSHGPDEPFPGLDVKRPVAPKYAGNTPLAKAVAHNIVCDGNGQSGYRVEVLYVHGSGNADRYNQYLASFRGWASEVDDIYNTSAAQTGGTRHIRYVTDSGCNIVVDDVAIDNGALNDFGNSVNAVKALGYNRTDRKYLMFVDTTALCGIAYVLIDSQPGQGNANNVGPSFARVDSGCWAGPPAAHELTHAMGAVNSDSPNHTQYGHCTDDYDIMCYQDGPGTTVRIICPDKAQDNLLDCNHDDYFNTNPPAGSYLATHWNTANNRFLITSDTPAPSGGTGAITGLAGKCVDIPSSTTTNGTPVELWDCNGGANQTWTVGGDGTVRALGKCLDIIGGGTANGTLTELWDCHGGANQVWRVSGSTLVNPQSNRCLDVPNGNSANGTRLQIWDCNSGANQIWRLPV